MVDVTEKPLRADARRNRVRVLEAAQEAFAAEGAAVPLDEIARRAGVGAGTVYRHFPTKEALFEAVILHRVQELVDDARVRADADDPGEAFFGFLARLAETAAAKRDLTDALAGGGAGVNAAVATTASTMNEALAVLLRRAQEVGAARTDVDITHVTALLKGALVAVQQAGDDPTMRPRIFAVVADGLRQH